MPRIVIRYIEGAKVTYGRLRGEITRSDGTWWSTRGFPVAKATVQFTWPSGRTFTACWPLNNVAYLGETPLIGEISFYFFMTISLDGSLRAASRASSSVFGGFAKLLIYFSHVRYMGPISLLSLQVDVREGHSTASSLNTNPWDYRRKIGFHEI